ncbi:hypothetical protein FACS189426_22850 [Bacteroidia bacterium]|nr:hypothetical protein FACS189426_22850 [Bacteroidia bacterium]
MKYIVYAYCQIMFMELKKNKIVLMGAGNVATHLGLALQEKGFSIVQVYSRTFTSAERLGNLLQTNYTNELQAVYPDADIYIFSVKDAVLSSVLGELPALSGLLIHTAGSLPLDAFAGCSQRFGVLYPLQTFGKNRKISFENIPVFIEANNPSDEQLLEEIASVISNKVFRLTSEKRKFLHLAAVFACNFTNHLYAQAAEIMEEQDLPWELLLPLVQETADKIKDLHPREAQTGPAVRYDENVINRHLELLNKEVEKQTIYLLLSQSIHRKK